MLTETCLRPSDLRILVAEEGAQARTLIRRPPVERALHERAEALLVRGSQEALPLTYLGTMPLFSGHRVYAGQEYDWVLVNLAEDPLFHDRDGFPVPGHILDHLRAVKRAGTDFDALYVAYEIEKGQIREGERLTADALLPPPPRSVERLSHQLGKASEALWAVAAVPLVVSLVVGAAVGTGVLMAAPALAAAGASCLTLDPVLLGTIVAPGRPVRAGELACWFYLTHWAYGEEI